MERKRWRVGLVALAFATTLTAVLDTASAQGVCGSTNWQPTLLGKSWRKNTTVYYLLDATIFRQTQINQIVSAVSDWNVENQRNGSGVLFVPWIPGLPTPTLFFSNQTEGVSFPFGSDGCRAAAVTNTQSSGSRVTTATVHFDTTGFCNGQSYYVETAAGYETFFKKVTLHEVGHTMGLNHPLAELLMQSIMNRASLPNDILNNLPLGFTPCDQNVLNAAFQPPPPDQQPPRCSGTTSRARPGQNPCDPSPIVIDVDGDGFDFSSADDGVAFDLTADGKREQVGWPVLHSDDAFLVLDRNRNGFVDDGTELFGNFTEQPASKHPNGFIALAELDRAEKGGNGDGVIGSRDAAFGELRLWIDHDRDGLSRPDELYTLPQLHVRALDLDYRRSLRRDRHGNEFRYSARVHDDPGADVGRRAYDVFPAVAP